MSQDILEEAKEFSKRHQNDDGDYANRSPIWCYSFLWDVFDRLISEVERLRDITGEDKTMEELRADCPECGGQGWTVEADPSSDIDNVQPMQAPCQFCNATGEVEYDVPDEKAMMDILDEIKERVKQNIPVKTTSAIHGLIIHRTILDEDWNWIISEVERLRDIHKKQADVLRENPEWYRLKIESLTSEVERLRSMEVNFGKLKIQADGLDEQRREQIDSLTKERDEYKDKYHKRFDELGNERMTNAFEKKKLEAENAELKKKVEELNGQLIPFLELRKLRGGTI